MMPCDRVRSGHIYPTWSRRAMTSDAAALGKEGGREGEMAVESTVHFPPLYIDHIY